MPHRFLDLPTETQATIADVIECVVAKHCDVIDIEDALTKENPEMRQVRVPIEYLQPVEDCRVTMQNVLDYAKLPAATQPPVIRDGAKLLDGAHRVLAAAIRQEPLILSVDIGFLLGRSWS